ncbi:7051_t:CDS:2 [Paraglomus brasilianum]|uniref:7051_t:CDS:1 n=1 Tax=Paraglomus brasilianum TaxID=144538 RepID=A0A9N8YWB6_9GLOM|nr:7051_t:CDS:2 [Paraglomus brasilianum]
MTPNTTEYDEDDELYEVMHLVEELSAELAKGRENMSSLLEELNDLKLRCAQYTSPLIRANFRLPNLPSDTDPPKVFNTRLTLEHESLLSENAYLSSTVKEYETTLQYLMSKFRLHSYRIQQNKLDLQREHENLILAERVKRDQLEKENALLQAKIVSVAEILRKAVGYQNDPETIALVKSLLIENEVLRELTNVARMEVREKDASRDEKQKMEQGNEQRNEQESEKNHELLFPNPPSD